MKAIHTASRRTERLAELKREPSRYLPYAPSKSFVGKWVPSPRSGEGVRNPSKRPALGSGNLLVSGTGKGTEGIGIKNPFSSGIPIPSGRGGGPGRGEGVGSELGSSSGPGNGVPGSGFGFGSKEGNAAIRIGSIGGFEGYLRIQVVSYEDSKISFDLAAMEGLRDAMNKYTGIRTSILPGIIPLKDRRIMDIPFLYMSGESSFALSAEERESLRRYIIVGGTLLISDYNMRYTLRGPFHNSLEFELYKILGESGKLLPIPLDHEIYKCFFRIKDLPEGVDELMRKEKAASLYGVEFGGRLAIIYDPKGYDMAWRSDGRWGKGTNEPHLRLGVNILVYVLTHSPMVRRW